MIPKFKRILSVFTIAMLFGGAVPHAQAEPPTAGDVLKQTQDQHVPMPQKESSDSFKMEVKDHQSSDIPKQDGKKIMVKNFRLEGQTIYAKEQLIPLLSDYQGKELTLGQLEEAAAKITAYYRQHGYIVAKAYVPAQKIQDHTVMIQILEGRYGNIVLNNPAGLNSSILNTNLRYIQKGSIVDINKLQTAVLMINDLPGISAKSSLTAGAKTGDIDLNLTIDKTKAVNGYVRYNNSGNTYTGKNQAGLGINLNNFTLCGDMLSLSGLTDVYTGTGEKINNGAINYQIPTNIQGLSFDIGYAKLTYQLGREFQDLGYNGTAKTFSLTSRYVLSRSHRENSSLNVSYQNQRLNDSIDSQTSSTAKRDKLYTIGLARDVRDNYGVTAYTLSAGLGMLDITGADINQTGGSYTKYNLELIRYQAMTKRLAFYGSFKEQWANKNLDAVEKFALGGINGVRAYPQGQVSGDEGNLLDLELRYSLPAPLDQDLQFVTFYETGRVRINKDASLSGTADQNYTTLSGAGLGIIWAKADNFSVKASYAWKVGNEQPTDGKNGRFWLEAVRYF